MIDWCRKTGEILGFQWCRCGKLENKNFHQEKPWCFSWRIWEKWCIPKVSARTWKKSNLKFEPRIDDGRKQSEMICAIVAKNQSFDPRLVKSSCLLGINYSTKKYQDMYRKKKSCWNPPLFWWKITSFTGKIYISSYATRFRSVRSPIFQMSINCFSISFARCFQLCEHVFQDFPVFLIVFPFLPRVFRLFPRAFPDFPTPRASTRSSAPH